MSQNSRRKRQAGTLPAQQANRKQSSNRKERKIDLDEAQTRSRDDSAARKDAEREGVPLPTDDGAKAVDLASHEDRLLDALERLNAQTELYRECAARANAREETAEQRRLAAEAAIEENKSERDDLTRERERIEAKADALRTRSRALEERERDLIAREAEADSGFPARRAAAEEALKQQLEEARRFADAALALQRKALESERVSFAENADRQAAALAAERAQLDEHRRRLDDDLAELHREKVAVERRERHLDQEVQAVAAVELRELEQQLHIKEAVANAANKTLEQLSAELNELRSRWSALGISDPRQLLKDLAEAQERVRELQDELNARPDEASSARLEALEQQNRALNAERERLAFELQAERGQGLNDRISALRVKQLADAEQQFAVMRRGYEQRIAELRGTVEHLSEGRPDPTEPLFPDCVAMDEDPALQERGRLVDDHPDLHELACNLQAAMWKDSRRAYRLDDVCAVLGGMAMSHLHLLEGMSGIGKTSLPKALAAALGTECAVIEVQAGWRDKYDLFGHYNTFERRFQEEPFLLALYKAQTPRYADRPFFIVLDEMNLSRPEQYFSLLLSKMENNDSAEDDQKPIRLAPGYSGRKPVLMDAEGTGIFLPENVWFVGTANQDESTLEFADKTYNRSFVHELPPKRPFVPNRGRVEPYSVNALRQAFDQAESRQQTAYGTVKSLLDELEDDLHEVCMIHVDSRVDKQLKKYVPVVVAARGTEAVNESGRGPFKIPGKGFDPVALAADQFIASKVLRQLRSRFDVNEGLDHLEKSVKASWEVVFGDATPERCLRVFAEERRRRGA